MLGWVVLMIINKKKKNYADSLSTPEWLFKLGEKRYRIKCNLDLAANNNNSKCEYYIDKDIDFLSTSPEEFTKSDILFGNFPHSKNYLFVKHTSEIYKKVGCRILLLLPINTLCSNYAKKYILPYIKFDRRMIIQGRIKFLNPISQKESKLNSVNGYVFCYYPKRSIKK